MNKKKKLLFWGFTTILSISTIMTSVITSISNSVLVLNSTTTSTYNNNNINISNLEISNQSLDEQTFNGLPGSLHVYVKDSESNPYDYEYIWTVNKNDGSGWQYYKTITGINTVQVEAQTTNSLLDWTFRCQVRKISTGDRITSQDIKFSFLPLEGMYINIDLQPTSKIEVESGSKVTISTKASIIGSKYASKEIGYQWFQYDSNKNSFTKIENANKSTYEFETKKYTENNIEKYVCRYYFLDNPNVYLSESNQAIVNIKAFIQEEIKITSLKASSYDVKSDSKITLSVDATSSHTKDLKFQWYVADNETYEFKPIVNATSSTYEYTAEEVDEDTKFIFMVMIKGQQYYLQSDNLIIKVIPHDEFVETPNYTLEVNEVIWTNQVTVNSNFNPWTRLNTWLYKVEVTNPNPNDNLTYKWYYVGYNGKEHLINNSNSNELRPNKDLFRDAYNDNSSHRVGIMCKIYNDGQLVKIVDQKTNPRLYLSIVTMNRKIKLLK